MLLRVTRSDDEGPSDRYDTRQALRQATALSGTTAVLHAVEILAEHVRTGNRLAEMRAAAAALAIEVRRRALPPERAIAAMRLADPQMGRVEGEHYPRQNPRYAAALRIFLQCFYVAC